MRRGRTWFRCPPGSSSRGEQEVASHARPRRRHHGGPHRRASSRPAPGGRIPGLAVGAGRGPRRSRAPGRRRGFRRLPARHPGGRAGPFAGSAARPPAPHASAPPGRTPRRPGGRVGRVLAGASGRGAHPPSASPGGPRLRHRGGRRAPGGRAAARAGLLAAPDDLRRASGGCRATGHGVVGLQGQSAGGTAALAPLAPDGLNDCGRGGGAAGGPQTGRARPRAAACKSATALRERNVRPQRRPRNRGRHHRERQAPEDAVRWLADRSDT